MSRLIGAIDIGTSGVRFVVFDHDARAVSSAYQEISLSSPKPGWVEQDPERLFVTALNVANAALAKRGIRPSELASVGLTNQKETTIVWDRSTGKSVYPAIVWSSYAWTAVQHKMASSISFRVTSSGFQAYGRPSLRRLPLARRSPPGLVKGLWKDFDAVRVLWQEDRRFTPRLEEEDREWHLSGWGRAVERAKG